VSEVVQLVKDQTGTPHLVPLPLGEGAQNSGISEPLDRGVDAAVRRVDDCAGVLGGHDGTRREDGKQFRGGAAVADVADHFLPLGWDGG
jgi:hypothetical protein